MEVILQFNNGNHEYYNVPYKLMCAIEVMLNYACETESEIVDAMTDVADD